MTYEYISFPRLVFRTNVTFSRLVKNPRYFSEACCQNLRYFLSPKLCCSQVHFLPQLVVINLRFFPALVVKLENPYITLPRLIIRSNCTPSRTDCRNLRDSPVSVSLDPEGRRLAGHQLIQEGGRRLLLLLQTHGRRPGRQQNQANLQHLEPAHAAPHNTLVGLTRLLATLLTLLPPPPPPASDGESCRDVQGKMKRAHSGPR